MQAPETVATNDLPPSGPPQITSSRIEAAGASVAPQASVGTLSDVETLSSRQVYVNPWMTFREDEIRPPDGSTGIYGVVHTPDIALIIPAEGDRLHLVEQYRYPVAAGSSRPEVRTNWPTSTRQHWPPASCGRKPGW